MEKYLNRLDNPSGPNLSITRPSIFFQKYFPKNLEDLTNKTSYIHQNTIYF